MLPNDPSLPYQTIHIACQSCLAFESEGFRRSFSCFNASTSSGIGLWRVNKEELLRQKERRFKPTPWTPTAEALRRPIVVVGRNDLVRDVDDALLTVKGFQVRLCIEAEKELQVLGCGWRIVTCQFRGNKVLLHHNGTVATMKRVPFKALITANRVARRKLRRPSLRLVVYNPRPEFFMPRPHDNVRAGSEVTPRTDIREAPTGA
jgi:hypothetical protein